MSSRYPSLGKLSLAILENYIKPIVGEAAVNEIKSPVVKKEIDEKIAGALRSTEKRFMDECPDKELCELLLALPLSSLPVVEENARAFFESPNVSAFSEFLRKRMSLDFPIIQPDRIETGVSLYVNILRQEITNISDIVRQKIMVLATLNTESNVTYIAKTLDKIFNYVSSQSQIAGANGAEDRESSNLELTIKGTDASEWQFQSGSRIIGLGRSPDNEVVIEESDVSWYHGYIERITNRYIYHHISQTNPTVIRRHRQEFLLTGKRLTELALQNDDRIIVGRTTFSVRFNLKTGSAGYVTTEKNEVD